jgi:hypothetical protein
MKAALARVFTNIEPAISKLGELTEPAQRA